MMIPPAEVRRDAYTGPFVSLIGGCANDPLLVKLAPISQKKRDRYEGSELITQLFACIDGYKGARQKAEQFLGDFVERHRAVVDEEQYRKEFASLLKFVHKHFKDGLASSKQQTPEICFEALAAGTVQALRERAELFSVKKNRLFPRMVDGVPEIGFIS